MGHILQYTDNARALISLLLLLFIILYRIHCNPYYYCLLFYTAYIVILIFLVYIYFVDTSHYIVWVCACPDLGEGYEANSRRTRSSIRISQINSDRSFSHSARSRSISPSSSWDLLYFCYFVLQWCKCSCNIAPCVTPITCINLNWNEISLLLHSDSYTVLSPSVRTLGYINPA